MVSNIFNGDIVPLDYVFPEEERPGKKPIPISQDIPVVDFQTGSKTSEISQILEAAQEFGFFQIINHGVSENTINDALEVVNEFMEMEVKDKESVTGSCVYTNSGDFAKDGVHLWRENLKHICHPLEDCMQFWPEKPPTYREVVGKYLVELRELSIRILEMIGEGLGLERGYFSNMSQVQLLSANYYPACPDPSLTLGVLKHSDPSLITILYQGEVGGLQVLKDGEWMGVGVISNAFVVNIGNQLEIISNGKLKSAEHRAVTNSEKSRTSIATFVNPSLDIFCS
jgi:isopenicillin N synthase-like dioxygenase